MVGREFALLRRERAFGEDRFDVRQEAVVLLVGRFDGRFGGGEPAPLHPLDFQLDRQSERIERGADGVGRHAGVDDRAENHVPADPAEAIEMGHAHGFFLRLPLF